VYVQTLGYSGIQAGAQEVMVEVLAAYITRMGVVGRRYTELGMLLYMPV
jgi:hypothetical protein